MNDEQRAAWIRLLALASPPTIVAGTRALEPLPPVVPVRPPEIGLVMVRGRLGGTGDAFNVGEMTVTRCTLRVGPHDGYACIAGRNAEHAQAAAVCDALLRDPDWHARVEAHVLAPIRRERAALAERRARQRAATTADFVSVVREREDG
ncbi:MAG TPA: phosphonate C-P lyase system protein PhnG [Candidatus Elarobacter sp.]|nr:phosphonate C-P lyase system protein PhnG [Candidatus Elarobacter sp.]